MNPEQIAHELELINNRDMSEQTANMFMTELHKQLRHYPKLKNNPLILKQIEIFEYELGLLELDWAQEQLAALQRFKSERGMLAGEVDGNIVTPTSKEVLNEMETPRAGSVSLETLSPAPDSFFVLEFAESTLVTEGFEYTVWGVKEYQAAHNIGVDGIIGRDTYLEMTAGTLFTQAQKNIETAGISEKTLWAIKSTLETANKKGANIILIRFLLKDFEANHSNDANFNTRYKEFFDWYNNWEAWYNTSAEWQSDQASLEETLWASTLPGWQAETPEQKEKRESLYRRVMSGEYGVEDLAKDMGDFATNPLVIIFIWWLFLFGKIGAGTKATDSWWKRVLIVGTMAYHKDSVKDIISDLTGTAKEWWNKEDDETPQEALKRNINDPESSLSKAFDGDTTLQTASIEEFQTEEVLKNIKLVDIPGYITAINEKKDIPTFLSHIEVDGKILTLEQVRIILEGIYETSKDLNLTYIHEVLSAESDADINAVSMVVWGIWTLVLGYFSFPVLASVAAVVWVLWTTGNMGTVVHDFGPWIQSFLSSEKWKDIISSLESALSKIQDPNLKTQLGTASKETDLGKKLQMIQDLKSQFPKEAQEIQNVIDSLIQIEVAAIESIINESLQAMTPEQLKTTQTEATKLLTTIKSYDTWNKVLPTLHTLIQKIENQIPLATQEEMEKLLSTQEHNKAQIERLQLEIEARQKKKITAPTTEVAIIDKEIKIKTEELQSFESQNAEISLKIPALEVEIANQEVQARISQVQAQKEFLEGLITKAQNTEGLFTVLSVNQETFTAMKKILDESKSSAEKSTSIEKETLLALIAEVEAKIIVIVDVAKAEITKYSESLKTQQSTVKDFDFLSATALSDLQRKFSEESRQGNAFFIELAKKHNITSPLNIETDILSLYNTFLIGKRAGLIKEFIEGSNSDITWLKEKNQKIWKLTTLATTLNWPYDSVYDFEAEKAKKQEEILDTPFTAYQPIVEKLKWYTIPSSIEATKRTQLEAALADKNLSVKFLLEILRNPDFQAWSVVSSIENYILIK